MRTSSRPVDMVLSIMGLFGVTLDPAAFHEDDRHGATLALARKILEAGGRPNWLGAAFHLEFNDSIPTFPVFPIASPAGPAYVRVKDKEVEVSQCFGRPLRLSGNTLPFPTCTIDDAGRLVLTAGATRIQTLADVSATTRFIKAMDGSRWSMMSSDTDPQAGSRCAAYVARIGLFGHQYEETNISTDLYTIRLMVLEEHHPALFHLRSYAYLHGIDEEIVRTWPECTLRIGTCKKVANPSETGERTICDVSASSLGGGGPLKIFDGASTCRFRLIDCEALVERDRLRIIQFPDIPTLSYTTISYPWRGVTVDSTFTCHRFRVDGAPDADPISVHILKQACTASLIRGSPYLWVDTLFIIQTSDEDKIWQIKLMYRVYKSCALCIVVPGGLQRLVPLDEETPWIHRSWTLQEAIAPSEVVVLFAWKLGWAAGGNMAATGIGNIHEVVPGECAIAPLTLILNASAEGFLAVQPASREYTSNSLLACCIFGAEPFANPSGAASSPGSSNRKLLAPVVVALAMAMDTSLGDPEIRAHAVWQSALMRTSFRPVDMILSIMGVFGVSLDPAAFQMDDRRGAAIALAQEILKRGGRASWLGAACGVPPEKTLSTFPSFPRNTTNGAASIHVNGTAYKVPDLVGAAIYPLDHAGLGSIPKGSMDDAGYLTFSARAIPLRYLASEPEDVGVVSERTIEALDGSRWALGTTMGTDSLKPARRAVFGALLGWTSEYYPGLAPFAIDNIRVMVLEEHRAKQFHVRTFFYLSRCEVRNILTWPERTFSVGGPHTPADICKSQAGEASPQDDTSWSPRHHPSDTLVQLEETASQYACRALPQLVLERFRQDALREHSGEFYVWTGTNVPPEHCYDKLRLAM
ncbi:hypothetical protein C8T65DRAFT_14669 [Cerioporus squamosus]|nr:hypothetical protein C8T65DRAFT_14669 [Cerioporus squamosus]